MSNLEQPPEPDALSKTAYPRSAEKGSLAPLTFSKFVRRNLFLQFAISATLTLIAGEFTLAITPMVMLILACQQANMAGRSKFPFRTVAWMFVFGIGAGESSQLLLQWIAPGPNYEPGQGAYFGFLFGIAALIPTSVSFILGERESRRRDRMPD